MTKLSVNVNKIATLRNTRTLEIPDLAKLATIALEAGAHGLTVHPRPDERHIRPNDVLVLSALLKRFPNAEYNLEGNPFHGLVAHCQRVRPTQATLVPDTAEAFTSNQGFNLVGFSAAERLALRQAVDSLHACGSRVSLFLDPIPEMMPLARDLGADRVELYTEPFAEAFRKGNGTESIEIYARAARAARDVGLAVNAGHDLNLDNLGLFLRGVSPVAEVSIGHALIADALEFGMALTVRRYLDLCAGT